ncbi:MAG TPA: hypothetical protein VGJ13_17005 [Pseudonocardiaceae bacterium]|jgi:nitrite reductase/ring-hydroxylating ferredoxin subunit
MLAARWQMGRPTHVKIVCSLHNHMFSVADGSCLNGDFLVQVHPVREENREIVVDL